jgi:hypothetical protein
MEVIQTIRVGAVGLGFLGKAHFNSYKTITEVQVAADKPSGRMLNLIHFAKRRKSEAVAEVLPPARAHGGSV